jgi:hypothetical protein
MKMYIRNVTILLVGILSASVYPQYDVDNRLRLEITPYVWMTTMNGDLTVNGEYRKVNFTFEDFFKFSNLGLNGHVELKKPKWAILFDYNYVDLLIDDTKTELTLWELAYAWRISKGIEILGGGRYFKSTIEYLEDSEQTNKGKESWIDPIIGGRLSWDMTRTLVFTARADVGGFGVGSEFSWNLMAGVGYRLSNITFTGFYRIWYSNYENGTGDEQFIYDLTTSGPGLAMVLHF